MRCDSQESKSKAGFSCRFEKIKKTELQNSNRSFTIPRLVHFNHTTEVPGMKQHPLTPGIANFILASSQQRKPKKQVRCYDGFRKSGNSLVGSLLLYTFPSPRQEGMCMPAYAPSKLPLVPVHDTWYVPSPYYLGLKVGALQKKASKYRSFSWS